MMEQGHILKMLDQLSSCQKETKTLFGSIFQPFTLEKGSILYTSSPSTCGLYFVEDGLLHFAKDNPTAQQKQMTIGFHLPHCFFNIQHLVGIQYFKVKAIKKSQLLFTSNAQISAFCKRLPEGNEMVLDIYQHLAKKTLDHFDLLHTEPALERYKIALKQLGHHLFQIPQYHLASYLLISRKHLGRLNRQLLNKS